MDKINQGDIAEYLGISEAFLSEIKSDKKRFSRIKAREVSGQTGVPVEALLYSEGDRLYQMLVFAYLQRG